MTLSTKVFVPNWMTYFSYPNLDLKKKSNRMDGKTLPISLNSKFQLIPMYHGKDHNTSCCKKLKIGHQN
jgi:hypothetical protein